MPNRCHAGAANFALRDRDSVERVNADTGGDAEPFGTSNLRHWHSTTFKIKLEKLLEESQERNTSASRALVQTVGHNANTNERYCEERQFKNGVRVRVSRKN